MSKGILELFFKEPKKAKEADGFEDDRNLVQSTEASSLFTEAPQVLTFFRFLSLPRLNPSPGSPDSPFPSAPA